MEITQKTISLSIIGKPNAGKSSLLNKLIGQKISIVTNKVQTTRSIITGIVTIKDTQLIILDTPGIFEPKKQLEKAMVRCAWSSLHGVDLVLLIIDSTKPMDQFTLQILKKLQTLRINLIFLLNKIDSPSEYLEEIENTLRCQFIDNYILRVSVLSGENINKLLNYIQSQAKQSPWLYEEDDVTNLPMRFLAAEITREQLFLNLHQELPYNLTVQTEMWQENNRPLRKLAYAKEFEGDAERRTSAYSNVREDSSTASTYKLPAEVEFPERSNDKSIKIHQVIVVSRDSYKTIILGKNGCKIKEIGSKARIEMQKAFDCKIHLFLFVKVRELWQNDPNSYSHMRLQQAQI